MTGIETMAAMASLAGAGVRAYGAVQGGKVAQAESESAARMLEQSAASDKQRADWERAVSQQQAERRRKEASRLLSKQQTMFAASGGGLTGSAEDVMLETAVEGDLNARIEQMAGEERARGIDDNARAKLWEAESKRRAGSERRKASWLEAGSTILQGVSSWGASRYGKGGWSDLSRS